MHPKHLYLFLFLLITASYAKAQSTTYTEYPELELRAEKLLIQDTEALILQIDHWVDSLELTPKSKTWQYLMLYKAEAFNVKAQYVASFGLISLVDEKMRTSKMHYKDPHLYFRVLSLSGSCHELLGDRESGLDSLQKAVKIAGATNNYNDQVIGHIMMAEAMRDPTTIQNSDKHLHKALEICEKQNLAPNMYALVYDRYAACSVIHNMTIAYSNKAAHYAQLAGNKSIYGMAHLQLAMVMNEPVEFKDSLVDIAIDNFRQIGDIRNLGLAFLDRVIFYQNAARYEEALVYLDSVEYLRDGRDWPYLAEYYLNYKYRIYSILEEKDSMIYYMSALYAYQGEKIEDRNMENAYFVDQKFQDELQALTIREQDFQLEQSERNLRLILIILAISGVFLFALAWFILRLRKQKREIEDKQAEIALINSSLESSLEENKVLLYETHHRVKNNLQVVSSLLELQSESSQNDLLENALAGAQTRISAMAFVHELLYKQDDLKNVDLSQYLTAVSRQIALFYGGEENLEVSIDCHHIQFPIHRAIHLGIFINELLTNSHKYARKEGEPLRISIELKQSAEMHHLHYQDNGPGLPNGLESGNVGSIGLFLLKSMARQLRGKLTYAMNNGASFKIDFKK